MLRRIAAAALVAGTIACRGDRAPAVAAPSVPDVPVAIRPASGGAVDSQTPSLVVLNARGFDAGQATYEFVVLDASGTRVVQDITGVSAGSGQTEAASSARPTPRGNSDQTYSGILSLGEDGYVTVDMGVCITDQDGTDLRVFQYVQFEGVGVDVSGSADGPWVDLGTQPCGDGGTGDRSNHCDFDLAGTGLKTARYVRVSDGERFPCERAGTRSEGADIDAVQALHVRN